MANITFVLREPKAKEQTPIILLYRLGSQRLKYSTGLKTLPKYWNETTQRIRNVIEVKDKDTINNFLSELEAETARIVTRIVTSKLEVTKELLKQHIDVYLERANADTAKDLFSFIELFIKQSANRINPASGKKIEHRTIQKYNTTLADLKAFATKNKRRVDFDTIDLDFYLDYTAHLQALNHSTNTIGKYIQTLKVFLNEATNRGLNTKFLYKSNRFKVVSELSDSIYLNEKELKQLYEHDFTENKRLERVRDMFIVGCWTGLRFSDFTTLHKRNVKGNFIEMKTEKTGAKVVIPIHPNVRAILEKYDYKLPNEISNQKMNDYLKDVGKEVELTEQTSKGITKGGVKRHTNYEKYELITTHTARRSFATNLYKTGFPAISIMQITGHKTEKAFLRYIKVTPQEHAEALQLHWAKSGSYLKVV
jgi:Site-specific recombinase XerD